ncbi:uncharacterized protein LOC119177770 isoform X2 [Rhipicephalus microplus]|uniref:uncharacterized protein LOC119177770 isoform X2 n=1 Tax=Rhipicephalus microplus TaxID=6941 RepID=UPI003F6D341A
MLSLGLLRRRPGKYSAVLKTQTCIRCKSCGLHAIKTLEDGDTLMSPEDAATSGQMESISTLACVYLQAVAPADQRSKTLCDSIADVALQLAKISLLDKPPKERMTNYSLETWDTVAPLEALFQAMNGSRSYMGDNKPVLLKNQRLVVVIKTLSQTMPEHVYRYVGFHATAYLSPYLDSMEAFWEMALFATARRVPRRKMPRERIGRMVDELSLDNAVGHWPPEKWRICLHVIDRLLPGVLVVAFSRNANDTTFFTELMADVIAEEVRSTFIDHVGRMAHFDNWTRRVFKTKAKTTNLYSMFPLRQFFHASILEYAKKVQAKVQNANTSLDIFLKASAFVGSTWSDPKQDIMHENRFGSTLFDTDCLDWPQHDTVMIPMGMFNHSIPTSPSERMFHVPSIGYRLAACLFQETFPENFYNPFSIYWTREATAALKARQDCFAKQYRANDYRTSYAFTRIAENAALRVAYESYCSDYTQDSADKKIFVQDRVNVPLMNMEEFATAFQCASKKPMNPSKRCFF